MVEPFQDYYESQPVYNQVTRDFAKDAVIVLYAITDTFLSGTPLTPFDRSGNPITPLKANADGFTPQFVVPGHTQVIAKAGPFAVILTSMYGPVIAAGLDPVTVAEAIDAAREAREARDQILELAVQLPDADDLPDGYVPVTAGGAWGAGPLPSGGSGSGAAGLLFYVWNGSAYVDANGAIPPTSKPAGYWVMRIFLTNGDPTAPFPTYPTWVGVTDHWVLPSES